MISYLIKRYVKNYENIEDPKVRYAYGFLVGNIGIVCNLFLFLLKTTIGTLTHSLAILSDGFNNLTDSLSNLITIFGYRLAAKPADRQHPFGHGRMEYIISLVMVIFIFVVGFELLKTSFDQLFHPSSLAFSWPMFLILFLSIGVKVFLYYLNRKVGESIHHLGMKASAMDARNDIISTLVALFGLGMGAFNQTIPFDALMSILIGFFILYSGYELMREIIDRLLGKSADVTLVSSIKQQMLSHPMVKGVHDMMIHDYGPGKLFGSAHAEVDANEDFLQAHEVIDQAEREIYEKYHVSMTIHLDPIDTKSEEVNAYREKIQNILQTVDVSLSFHDFRIVKGEGHTNLIFDVSVPFECKKTNEEIKEAIDQKLEREKETLYTVITFDRAYVSESIGSWPNE